MRLNSMSLLVVILSLALPAIAAEPVHLQDTTFVKIKQKFQLSLPGNVKNAVGASDSLRFIEQHSDRNKTTHVRMQQYYAGFPVFGGYAILHSKQPAKLLAASSDQVLMNGTLFDGLKSELGQPQASFLKNAPVVLQQFKDNYVDEAISEAQVMPLVYIDNKQQAHWAYKVSLLISSKHKIPERPTAIIDAKTYAFLMQWNNVKTEVIFIKGTGFGGNPKIGEYQYGKELPFLDLMRDVQMQMCFMENADVRIVDMGHKFSSKNMAMKFACTADGDNLSNTVFFTGYSGDGYDKSNGAASPTNDAMYAGFVIKHLYHDWYGIEVLTRPDGSPKKLIMRVHYGEGYENAYWDGRQMTFGDGGLLMYPLVSLGIGAHEISHGFTEQHAGLEYFGESGGINESFSDMAAQAAEFYSTGKSSWQIGLEVMKEDSGYQALRYMDKPSRDGLSIDTAEDYYGGLDVHYSSGVFNRLFYLLSTKPNWNVRRSFDVMVKANMDYWTPYATFEEAACGVLYATKDLRLPLDDVKKSLAEVAINFQTCPISTVN